MTDPVLHGGGLRAAEARFGRPTEGWLDLSTGISPWAYPMVRLPAAAWRRLPEPEEIAALETAAATAYGVGDPAAVVAAPGAQALIQWLPRLRPQGRVAAVGFTYGEHAHCWRAAGHAVTVVDRLDGAQAYDVAVLVNPNNPDGRIVAPAALLAAADAMARRGGLLVVDEAFADAVPAASVATAAGRPGLCVLRSFGKMYGLAGLRLGFALTSPELASALRAALGPWAVGGPAVAVGAAALADRVWRDRMVARLAAVEGGAAALHGHLARAGILTRAFPERPDWLRFGIPGGRAAEVRLAAALRSARAAGGEGG